MPKAKVGRKKAVLSGNHYTSRRFDVVAVGASAGGFHAIAELLGPLPANFTGSILVVQHLDPARKSLLADLLLRHAEQVPLGAEFVECDHRAEAPHRPAHEEGPPGLFEAIRVAEGSKVMRDALGEHVHEFLIRNKREEWDSYKAYVTPYELERYLPIL